MIGKTVSFGETSTHTVETVPQDCKGDVWYTGRELQELNREEVLRTKEVALSQGNNKAALETADLSWRGLESLQKGKSREGKIFQNINAVVLEYRRQMIDFGSVDEEDLRHISKAHSRNHRIKARKMGSKDAEAAQQEFNVKPKYSGKFAWFHKELAAFRVRQLRVFPSQECCKTHKCPSA